MKNNHIETITIKELATILEGLKINVGYECPNCNNLEEQNQKIEAVKREYGLEEKT